MIMETLIYEKLGKGRVRCGICRHFCVISEGERGLCMVRKNIKGRLLCLSYPKLVAAGVDPIEKKPVFHFRPGSLSYSIASVGCNFQCDFCQNSDIAQMPRDCGGMIQGRDITPESIVSNALGSGCDSIAYTYTEPTVFFELAFETAKLAKQRGLFNIFVTNGYMSGPALEMIRPYLDIANVDLKAFNDRFYQKYCRARLEPVKKSIRKMKDSGMLVEITTLLVPGLNDNEDDLAAMAEFIASDLGPETPWHISRFHPCYRMQDRPATDIKSLKKAFETGKKAGLHYVYTGNAPGLASENTFCQNCGTLVVERTGYHIKNYFVHPGRCPSCNTEIYGIY